MKAKSTFGNCKLVKASLAAKSVMEPHATGPRSLKMVVALRRIVMDSEYGKIETVGTLT